MINEKQKLVHKERIDFHKTSDPFISAGISGLIKYCEKRKEEKNDIEFEINKNVLTISAKNLNEVLKEIYYDMGRDYYDTSGQKQIEKNEGFYYDEVKGKFFRFPKVKPRGLALLIHSGQPTPKATTAKKKDIKKEKPVLYQRIIDYCKKGKIPFKDDSKGKIWINSRNTNVPSIEELQISIGNKSCSICGNKFKKLYESVSYSPFIGGSSAGNNYVSMLKSTEKICWKCLYIQRFSPTFAFYKYSGDWNVFIFSSESIDSVQKINTNLLKTLFYDKDRLIKKEYLQNFDYYKFEKDKETDYFKHNAEQLFMLLFTIYQQMEIAKPKLIEKNEWLPFQETVYYKTEVFYIRSKPYSGTFRPLKAEKFTDIHYIFSVFKVIEQNNMNIQHLLWALKLNDGDDRTVLRNRWADHLLNRKPTIKTCEEIVWKNFMNKNFHGNFYQILNWLNIYESIINYGGNKHMNNEIRELAVNLGKQLGYFNPKIEDNPNIRKGKLIQLRKAKNLKQFNEVVVSFLFRYNTLKISSNYVQLINEQNFDYFRQFTLISALNTFNSKQKKENQNEG
ncbi:hypothetical protein H8E88_32105 [candidate division KSB1 bacterium]|nr:hypothetical protein [candidate division KSB1 bacterium]